MYSIYLYVIHTVNTHIDICIYFIISCCDRICPSVCYLEVHVWFQFYVYLIELTLGEGFGARDDWDSLDPHLDSMKSISMFGMFTLT